MLIIDEAPCKAGQKTGRPVFEDGLVLPAPCSFQPRANGGWLKEAYPAFLSFVESALIVHDVNDVMEQQRAPQVEIVKKRDDRDDPEQLLDWHAVTGDPAEEGDRQVEQVPSGWEIPHEKDISDPLEDETKDQQAVDGDGYEETPDRESEGEAEIPKQADQERKVKPNTNRVRPTTEDIYDEWRVQKSDLLEAANVGSFRDLRIGVPIRVSSQCRGWKR